MSALNGWRALLRPLISRGFLRRDQGEEGLLISDFPRHLADAEEKIRRAGFTVAISGGMARIDATEDTYRVLMEGLPMPRAFSPREEDAYLYFLALRLIKADTPIPHQPLAPIRLTLKCLDGGEWDTLARKLPPMIALLQRQHMPLPSAAGKMILAALEEKGEKAC
ncbi:MAG: hypothetical protein E7329_00935 [Clostridiales bacterium]|nr:hypothetical protein [Clostridiales bacterium]